MNGAVAPVPCRELDLRVGAATRRVRLAAGAAGDVITRVRVSPGLGAEELVFAVLEAIDVIDGEPPGYDEAVGIVQDAPALGRLLGERNRWLGELRTRARFRVLCPHCREREAVLGLVTVALALSSAPPPLTVKGGAFLAVPTLAAPHPPGRRLDALPAAASISLELPSGLLAPEGDLHPVTTLARLRRADDLVAIGRQEDAWTRLAPAGSVPDPDYAYRHAGSVGFTAIVRMASALVQLDEVRDVAPEDIERLSVADFIAIDAGYFLVANADQPRPGAGTVTCENCTGTYLPLLGS